MSVQDDLFASNVASIEEFDLKDGKLIFYPQFLNAVESDHLFQDLLEHTRWEQNTIKLYGKELRIPRLNAWYGDEGAQYEYSGSRLHLNSWTPSLLQIKHRIEQLAKHQFNSVLLNCYRDGRDSVSWHSDDEPELGENPLIASLSLGETRRFHLKHRFDPLQKRIQISLSSGSLLIMSGKTQHFWHHQVPKSQKACQSRINLTFRRVFPSKIC